ncbi:hypothetical protein PVAG01_02679 [Phlyctema vagabunda]|uniref:Uncharacterized protein n=1 Tax=Phlyctema vagabunda TaxID=108571 RepID=A0ABR4PRT8_9HELO
MDTDRLIPYLVQIQRLNEEINMAFDLDGQNQLRELDPFRIELLVKSFNERLDVLRSSFLPEIWDISSIAISYYHTRIYVYEVAFHAVRPSPSDLAGPQLSNNSWYFANARTEMLIRCLNAATTYVDHYISLRPDDIYSLVSTDQMKLLYAILVLGRLATCVKDDAPLLDAGLVRTMANIDYYLASVIQKLEGLLTSDANGQTRQNYIYHLSFLFQHSRRWYNQLEAAGDTGLTANFPSMFCTDAILPCPKNNESRKEDQMWSDFVNMGSTSIVDAFNIP